MHELSFAQQILEVVVREAQQYPAHKVVRIKVRASDALVLEPSSLRFCLEAISMDTVAEGAVIEINETNDETDLMVEEIELDEYHGET